MKYVKVILNGTSTNSMNKRFSSCWSDELERETDQAIMGVETYLKHNLE